MKPHAPSRRAFLGLLAAGAAAILGFTSQAAPSAAAPTELTFFVAGDMRNFVTNAPAGKRYFDAAAEAMHQLGGAFLVTPGDADPVAPVRAELDRVFGRDFPWYIVVGNHEFGRPEDIAWVRDWAKRGIPGLVRRGPENSEATTFSFDVANSHFVAFDNYPDPKAVSKTDISDATFEWLEKDLAANQQPIVWMIGHTPIEAKPDMENGRLRHGTQSISPDPARVKRFVDLMKRYHVRAYLCGHTHNTSVVQVQGVWQADTGHARGAGDSGTRSTFLRIRTRGTDAWIDIYRADANGQNYTLVKTVALD